MNASSAAPADLREEVSRLWPETAAMQWLPLTPDGSDRMYYRLRQAASGDARSVILMVYRGTNATPVEGFLEVHRLFERSGLPVARLESERPAEGLFLMEDLGDTTLEAAAAGLGPDALEPLYRQAVEILVHVQALKPPADGPRPQCFDLAFDEAKLRFEMDFFFEHMVRDFLGLDLESAEARAARDELYGLCRELGQSHPVLAHRDYHCRNLMVQDGRLRLIDYQDARMGRRAYDVASLIFDSYIDLGDALRERLLGQYERLAPGSLPEGWRAELLPMAAQRSIKALGSFGYLMGKKGKGHFASAVGTTLRHLSRNLPGAGLSATARFVLGPLAEACRKRGYEAPGQPPSGEGA